MLDINTKVQKYKKTLLTYLIASIIAILVNNIYAIFAHGVSSAAMTWMFLYPLLGGMLFYLMICILMPNVSRKNGYRGFYNMYNSGIATLTVASFLKGILEIAGTSSPYIKFFNLAGVIFIATGLIYLFFKLLMVINLKEE